MKLSLIPKRKLSLKEEGTITPPDTLNYYANVVEGKLGTTTPATDLDAHKVVTITHGATDAIADQADIATHAALTATHGVAKIAGVSSGNYTGNSAVDRGIAHGLGIIPKLVIIVSSTADEPWFYIHTTEAAIFYFTPSASAVTGLKASDATNFYVGKAANYSITANYTNYVYYWVAIG